MFHFRKYFVGLNGIAKRFKPAQTPAFGFESVDRKNFVISASRMTHMVTATRYCAVVPSVNQVDDQRGIYRNGWVQR